MGYYRCSAGLPHTVLECVPPVVTVRGLQVTESTVLYLLCLVQHRQQHSTTSHGHQCVYTISRRLCMFSVCMCVRTRARVCVCVAGCARPCPWGLLSWFNSAPLGWTLSDSWGPMKAAVQQGLKYNTAAGPQREGTWSSDSVLLLCPHCTMCIQTQPQQQWCSNNRSRYNVIK